MLNSTIIGEKQLVVKMPRNNSNGTEDPGLISPAELRDAAHPETITINRYKIALLEELKEEDWYKRYVNSLVKEISLMEKNEKEDPKRYSLDDLLKKEEGNFVLLGEPGIGKSTCLQKLALDVIESGDGVIPIYIDLKGYDGDNLLEKIEADIKDRSGRKAPKDLEKRNLILLIDSLDEAKLDEDKPNVFKQIKSLSSKLSNGSRIIAGCRINDYRRDLEYFNTLEVEKLDKDKIKRFLDSKLGPDNKLYRQLENDKTLMDFCGNPLLLTFVAQVADELEELTSKTKLYKKVIEREFYTREQREKYREYHIEVQDQIDVLSHLAYTMQTEIRTPDIDYNKAREIMLDKINSFSEDEKDKMIDKIKERVVKKDQDNVVQGYLRELANLTTSTDKNELILKDIIHSGLIKHNKAKNTFDFMHSTIREYLCAREINRRLEHKEKEKEPLSMEKLWRLVSYEEDKKLWGVGGRAVKPAWKETLLFLAGMLEGNKAEELVDIVSENYFKTRDNFDTREYNPHKAERDFASRLVASNVYLKTNKIDFVDKLFEILLNKESLGSLSDCLKLTKNKDAAERLLEMLDHNSSFFMSLHEKIDYDKGVFDDGSRSIWSASNILDSVNSSYQESILKLIIDLGDQDTINGAVKYLCDNSNTDLITGHYLLSKLNLFPDSKKIIISYLESYLNNEKNQEDYRIRSVISAYGYLKGKESIDILQGLLSNDDNDISSRAAEALAKTEEGAIVPILREYYHNGNTRFLSGIDYFCEIDHPIVLETLLEILDQPKYHKNRVIKALVDRGDQSIANHIIKSYDSLDKSEKRQAIESLGKLGSKPAVQFLIKKLEEIKQKDNYADDDIRLEEKSLSHDLISTLGKTGDTEALDILTDYILCKTDWVASFMAKQIMKIGPNQKVIQRIKNYLINGDKAYQVRAIDALGIIGDKSCLEVLSVFLNSNNIKILSQTIESIGRISIRTDDASLLDKLHSFLDSSHSRIVAVTAETLGYLGHKKSVPHLIKKIKKGNPNVNILHALAKINDPSTLEELGEYILRFDFDEFEKRDPQYLSSPELRSMILESDSRDEMRYNGVTALGNLNDPRSIPYLLEYFKTCPTSNKFHAAQILLDLGYKDIVPLLRECYSFRKGLGYLELAPPRDGGITLSLKKFHEKLKPIGY